MREGGREGGKGGLTLSNGPMHPLVSSGHSQASPLNPTSHSQRPSSQRPRPEGRSKLQVIQRGGGGGGIRNILGIQNLPETLKLPRIQNITVIRK